jgi:integrase
MNYELILKEKKPTLSDNSIKTYSSILRALNVNNDVNENTKKYIDELKDKNISTRKTALSALYILSNNKAYKDEMLKVINIYNDEIDKQSKTDKQKENWVNQDVITEIYNKMKSSINEMYKIKDYQKIQDYIIICLMSGIFINPRRLKDYCDFKIKNINKSNDNYLLRKKLYFNSYKGSDKKGLQVVPIPNELNDILKKWIKVNPTDYLLYNEKGGKLSNVVLNQRLNRIFEKKVSVNILRHSFLTDKHKSTLENNNILSDDMKMMGSSILQAKLYIKKD